MIVTASSIDRIDDVVTERLMAAADAHADELYGRCMDDTDIDNAAERGEADDHAIWLSEDEGVDAGGEW